MASDALITWLAGNSVVITDAPCGAGATFLSLLATVAELRANNVLPREPLDVTLIGADISGTALTYAAEMLNEMKPTLERQAIFVQEQWETWDITDSLSNTQLVRRMIVAAANKDRQLITIANFNAALVAGKKQEEAKRQIEELFRYAGRSRKSMAIWIEPAMNRATQNLFPWLLKLIREAWRKFAREKTDNSLEPIATSKAFFQLPLQPDQRVRVHLAVMAIELGKNDAA